MAEVTRMRNNILGYPVYGLPYCIAFPLLDEDGDPVTGLTCDSEVSKNGNTAVDCHNEGVEIAFDTATNKGMYYLDLTGSHTGTETVADVVAVTIYTGATTSQATCIVLYPKKLPKILTGTVGATGNDTTHAHISDGVAINDFYNGCILYLNEAGNDECRMITDYVASTKLATLNSALDAAPTASTSTYEVYMTDVAVAPIIALLTGLIPNAVAGAADGLFIAGTNAALTITGATTLSGDVTISEEVALAKTLAIAGATTLASLSVTGQLDAGNLLVDGTTVLTGTTTLSGDVTIAEEVILSKSLAIAGTTTLASLSVTGQLDAGNLLVDGTTVLTGTTTLSGDVTIAEEVVLSKSLAIAGTTTLASLSVTGALDAGSVLVDGTTVLTGATTLTGHLLLSDGIKIAAPSTGNRAGFEIIGNGTGAGITSTGGATGPGMVLTGGGNHADADGLRTIAGGALALDIQSVLLQEIESDVHGIGTAGGAAINVDCADDNVDGDMALCTIAAINAEAFIGTQGVGAGMGTFTATSILDGTIQQITCDGSNIIDIIYLLQTGGGTTPVGVVWTGRLNQASDTCLIQAWNHVTPGWETIGTIDGQSSLTANITKNLILYTRHRGTSADELGHVYLRFFSNATISNQILKTDQLYVSYSVTARTVGYADGAVWINTVTGATGTESYVYGTADNPVKTIAEALTIAAAVGLKRFRIANGSTITLGASVAGYSFVGHNWTLALAAQNIAGAYFEGAAVTGTSTGDSAAFFDCSIGATCTTSAGLFQRCAFNGTFTTVTGKDYTFVNCWDGRPGSTNNAIFILTATVTMGFRGWSGGIDLSTILATNTVVIEGYGRLIIDADCHHAGTIIVRGPFSITDNSDNGAGTTGFVANGGTLTQTERLITPPTAIEIIDNFETQSNADPTGFKVNVMEINGTAQTAGDVGIKTGFALSATGLDAVAYNATGAQALAKGVWADTTAGDFTVASSVGKSVMNGVALGTGLTVNDLTTKTGFSLSATGADLILKSSTFIQAIAAAINELATYGLTALNTLLVTTGIKAATVPAVTLANGAHGGASTVITLQTPLVTNLTQVNGAAQTATLDTIKAETVLIVADTNELQVDWTNGGRLDLLIDAIKVPTDKLVFTVANQVDVNVQYINDKAITGDGSVATPWGPA